MSEAYITFANVGQFGSHIKQTYGHVPRFELEQTSPDEFTLIAPGDDEPVETKIKWLLDVVGVGRRLVRTMITNRVKIVCHCSAEKSGDPVKLSPVLMLPAQKMGIAIEVSWTSQHPVPPYPRPARTRAEVR